MSENTLFFKDVEYAWGDTVKDFVFKEKYVDIPIGVIGIYSGLIFDFGQDTTNQFNVEEPPI